MIVYVDNIILTGDYEEELLKLKSFFSKEFEIKDLKIFKYFLGMEIALSKIGIFVSQHKYVLDLLKKTGMLGCKPDLTLMDSNKKIGTGKDSTPVERGEIPKVS